MAKVKGQNIPVREHAYKDADGVDHYFGEFYRDILGEGYLYGGDPAFDIVAKTRRGERPTEKGMSTPDQHPIRQAFFDCVAKWNSMPLKCPEVIPEPALPSKESVWDAKGEHGVPCSYYDLWMRCCIKFALAHGGAMPTDDCFPCESLCSCEGISIGYTTQGMSISEEQTLTAIGASDGCTYNWEIVSGGGSLSSNEGGAVLYTAPSTNPFCNLNATIKLSSEGEECDFLEIAVNAINWWTGEAYHKKTCNSESSCVQFTTWQCADVVVGSYQCTGLFRGIVGTCPSGGCTGPGCCCTEHEDCTMYFDDYCNGQSGEMSCAASAEQAGCTHPGSLDEGVDQRPDILIEWGCCPEGLL